MIIHPLSRFVFVLIGSLPCWVWLGLYLLTRFRRVSLRPLIPLLVGIVLALFLVMLAYPVFTGSFDYVGLFGCNVYGFVAVLQWVRRRFGDPVNTNGYSPSKSPF
jgi:hypothetical protein